MCRRIITFVFVLLCYLSAKAQNSFLANIKAIKAATTMAGE